MESKGMAAGRKLCSLVLLVALLATSATTFAARSHPTAKSLNKEIMRAFGVGRPDACCTCVCTLIYPPKLSKCACAGEWKGECPVVCKNCQCDGDNMCICRDGFTIKYNDCASNSCPYTGAAGGAHIRM